MADATRTPVLFEPTSGSVVHQYIDAESYLPIKTVVKVDVPQIGQHVEQATEFLDFREVDGIKMAFRWRATSSLQNYTITITKVEHNVAIDDRAVLEASDSIVRCRPT